MSRALTLRSAWPMYAGMAVAGAAAVTASASTLAALARAAGWAAWTPWLLPAALDVAGAAAGWCWLRPGAPDRARRFGRIVAIVAGVGTLVGNGAGHLVAVDYLRPGPVLVVVVGAVPAAVLVALAHLTALLTAGEGQAVSEPLATDVTQVTPEASGVVEVAAPTKPRPAAARDSRKGPAKLLAKPTPDDALKAARDVAKKLRADGQAISGKRLIAELRAAGVPVANGRGGELLAALDSQDDERGERVA